MRPRLRQHRTPEEATLSCGQRPAGALNLCEQSAEGGLLMSSCLSQGTRIHVAEVNAAAAASRKRKPISRASKRPCGWLRPCQDLSAPAEEASVSASSTQRPRQKQQSLAAMSESSTFPKVFHKTRSGRRDPRKLAAAMERVRQWEFRLLQNLEEASQHHLTVETENKRPVSQGLQFSAEDPPGSSSDLHTGHGLLSFWTHVH
ncbi:coiled-coil domain-containing protein 201 [Microtus pennsylvanicus]|uniref:coiled-coil domain-containing protein 201 n=1 Tax=Microtus pennsylvanicus TaxID=10058 RepID=UPI003F6D3B21